MINPRITVELERGKPVEGIFSFNIFAEDLVLKSRFVVSF
jgi:hypothetical protein